MVLHMGFQQWLFMPFDSEFLVKLLFYILLISPHPCSLPQIAKTWANGGGRDTAALRLGEKSVW